MQFTNHIAKPPLIMLHGANCNGFAADCNAAECGSHSARQYCGRFQVCRLNTPVEPVPFIPATIGQFGQFSGYLAQPLHLEYNPRRDGVAVRSVRIHFGIDRSPTASFFSAPYFSGISVVS